MPANKRTTRAPKARATRRALKGNYEETVRDHLASTTSAPFTAGEHNQIAVKVIDQRGNELLVVRGLQEVAQEQ